MSDETPTIAQAVLAAAGTALAWLLTQIRRPHANGGSQGKRNDDVETRVRVLEQRMAGGSGITMGELAMRLDAIEQQLQAHISRADTPPPEVALRREDAVLHDLLQGQAESQRLMRELISAVKTIVVNK